MTKVKNKTVQVGVSHITRIEGHGNIIVEVEGGELKRCDMEIVEAPRYFEALLRGQHFSQVPPITSRICGICSISHTLTSLSAVEKALGVTISEQSILLRKLSLLAEMIDSHILHACMLIAPDLLGAESVIALTKDRPEVVRRTLQIKKVAGDICSVICGRHTQPIALVVGGFSHYPSADILHHLSEQLEAVRADIEVIVDFFQSLSIPTFDRETEYIALQNDKEYCFWGDMIASTDGGTWPVEEYEQVVNEHVVSHSTAKHSRNLRSSYMVGALARYKINHSKLHPTAQKVASALDLTPECVNPFKNTAAQVVEVVQCYEKICEIIRFFIEQGISLEDQSKPSQYSGEGVGAFEAPRGTLYHHYMIEDQYLINANCVIPTAQNLANIEADMRLLVNEKLDLPSDKMTLLLEMLVRAYDPCISCATHLLEVEFVRK